MKTGASDAGDRWDAVVIGGGWFGCYVAAELKRTLRRVLVIEMGESLMQRASYNNQARVHSGYHYPRSLMTALRSSVHFPRFVKEFAGCVCGDFEKYYAVPRMGSKVNARQFETFMRRIGAPLRQAPSRVRRLLNRDLIEDVWLAREVAFDAVKLAGIGGRLLDETGVPVWFGSEVMRVRSGAGALRLDVERSDGPYEIETPWVFNCTYSRLNVIHRRAGIPQVPLKHELTEMALVELPPELEGMSFTLMCGPFFSVMPFPARGLHTLSHVRYTPHFSWIEREGADEGDAYERLHAAPRRSNFPYMIRDAVRFLPALRESVHRDSLWEVKTVLPQSELDDGRPILFARSAAMPGLVSVMGGKIDNVYDLPQELRGLGLN